jgi:RHS repeat-associated protein
LRNEAKGTGRGILENLTTERFYYQDATGNTSLLSDRYGNLLERYTYSGFGQPSFYDASGASLGGSNYDSRHLFQGQLWTPQTGLNDHRNRQALPSMGVFLQPDPIGI